MHKSLRTFVLSMTGALALCASIPGHAQSGDLLARVKANKEITVGTEARYAPFESIENGKIVGYDADLLQYVLKSLPDAKLKHSTCRSRACCRASTQNASTWSSLPSPST